MLNNKYHNFKVGYYWICLFWLLFGQILMIFIVNNLSFVRDVCYSTVFVKNFFPTVDRIGDLVFDKSIASFYLHFVGLFFPLIFLSTFFAKESSMFVEERVGKNYIFSKIVSFFFVIYMVHFSWDEGSYVRSFAWFKSGFALAGMVNYLIVAYFVRLFMKGR